MEILEKFSLARIRELIQQILNGFMKDKPDDTYFIKINKNHQNFFLKLISFCISNFSVITFFQTDYNYNLTPKINLSKLS